VLRKRRTTGAAVLKSLLCRRLGRHPPRPLLRPV